MAEYDVAFDGGIIIEAEDKKQAIKKLRVILLRNKINLHDYSIEVN